MGRLNFLELIMAKVLVVGCNRGIGLELVRQYAKRGDSVFALCRKSTEDLSSVKNVTVLEDFDVANDTIIKKLKGCSVFPDNFDVVIANAGVLVRNDFESLDDTESLIKQFTTNSVGPLRVARGIASRLKSGSKFGIITSRMGSVDDNGSGGQYGYRMSKSAVNAAGQSLSVDWKKDGIAVALLHPGYVRTAMTGMNGFINPDESATG